VAPFNVCIGSPIIRQPAWLVSIGRERRFAKRFQAKWTPARVKKTRKKTRKNKDLDSNSVGPTA
jgi:hypothetical protein